MNMYMVKATTHNEWWLFLYMKLSNQLKYYLKDKIIHIIGDKNKI